MLRRAQSLPPDRITLSRQRHIPSDIRQDFRVLERSRRVSAVLNSRVFRSELESLIQSQATEGPAKQRQTFRKAGDIVSEVATRSANRTMSTSSEKPCRETPMALPRAGCIIPIADLRGATASKYSKSERIVRNKLASLYRLIDLYGWSDGIYGHSSVSLFLS
jgi:adducin